MYSIHIQRIPDGLWRLGPFCRGEIGSRVWCKVQPRMHFHIIGQGILVNNLLLPTL